MRYRLSVPSYHTYRIMIELPALKVNRIAPILYRNKIMMGFINVRMKGNKVFVWVNADSQKEAFEKVKKQLEWVEGFKG